MSPNSGTVGPTPQEQALSSIAQQSFQDYQSKWLPLQDHFADTVEQMGASGSWQRQEAEGKGNADAAMQFANQSRARTSSELANGINVGSSKFKLGVSGMASAEAEAKGAGIAEGNEAIDKSYVSNLTSIAQAGQGLANAATQSAGVSAEVASREAISNAQVANAQKANEFGAIGFGIGALGQAGMSYLTNASGITDTDYGFDPSTGVGGGPDYRTAMAPAGTGIGGTSGIE
jgi:hypothetical protein